ncbi:hypothetical protein GA0070616_5153 [Micromonospora nigra]|uniref:Uncharacterized protein n=1 Tax=Micromonospora nigra TaxID=145857 RepID=A0A1C6T062_9ACTN|nr:hypothetical protein [Micromonospora nigra]SCL35158.1 hypothetical protein GA0070616_5153 [Micromonospora nigra]
MIGAAARDNAAWCDLVCRAHGLTGVTDADAWSVSRRSPPWYPDAVTLRPGVDPAAVLARIDDGPGASVKDSFADLDLTPHGFRVLFEATWIHLPPGPTPGASELTPVVTSEQLTTWATAHGGGPLFRAALLAEPGVRVLGLPDGHGGWAGGAVLHTGGDVVGVSNVFAADPTAAPRVWAGVCAAGADRHLVGYEHGGDLAVAVAAGFRGVGPLRVWLR